MFGWDDVPGAALMSVSAGVHVPALAGATAWLNSEPLGPAELHARGDQSASLTGEWTVGPENLVLDRAGGSIAYRFHARDAHLVLSPGAREPIPFRVLLPGAAPGPSHGVDVDEDGNGLLEHGRLYQLVREHDAVRERTLQVTFLEPGAKAYPFTFG